LTTSASSVTAPVRASTRPSTVVLLPTVAETRASRLPTKLVPAPRVTELPTCQKTLQDAAPLISSTRLPAAVVSVEPAWKTKTASGSPCASRVTVPVRPREESLPCTPGRKTCPPRSAETVVSRG
jgi:hypothetical protein